MPEIELKPAQIPLNVIVQVFNVLERKLIGQQTANVNDDKDTKILIKNIHNNIHQSLYSPTVKNSKNIFKDKLKKITKQYIKDI